MLRQNKEFTSLQATYSQLVWQVNIVSTSIAPALVVKTDFNFTVITIRVQEHKPCTK
jgi:hypothetical protein